MKKAFIGIIAIILIAGGLYWYDTTHKQVQAPASQTESNSLYGQQPAQSGQTQNNPATATAPSGNTAVIGGTETATSQSAHYSPPAEGDVAPNIQAVEVDFDGSKFSPSPVSIHVNDWVFFKNNSSENMWVASNPHPTHTDYPGFDSKAAIAPGAEYKFQFTKAGNWGYHDHLNPSIGGVVDVAQ